MKTTAAIVISLILCVMFFYRETNSIDKRPCYTTSNFKNNVNNQNFSYSIDYRFLFLEKNLGFVNIRGIIKNNNENYVISRTFNFTYNPISNKGEFDAKIFEVIKAGQDNVPDTIINQFFTYTKPNTSNYIKVEALNKNRLLISITPGAFIVCSH